MKKNILNHFSVKGFKQAVSAAVCLCFILTSVFPYGTANAVPVNGSYSSDKFGIPQSLGKIISAKYFGDDEIIINIQDLHCHAETQKSIAGILKYIDDNYILEKTYLEGAFGDIDTKWLQDLNSSEMGGAIVDNLLNFGYLNGVEYYCAVNGKDGFIAGIENEKLYKENIKLLNQIIAAHDEVSQICAKLSSEMKFVKAEYSNEKIKKFDRFVKRYEKGRLSQKRYYNGLIDAARANRISSEKYKSVEDYAKFTVASDKFKTDKISKQFSLFINEIKKQASYKEYAALSEKSGSFSNMENIVSELAELDELYSISENLKLNDFKNFLLYAASAVKLNPVQLAKEEKELKHEIFLMLGRNQYEQEVIELSEFIPSIESYFTANITSDELAVFNAGFKRFKSTWRSYFSDNTAKELDKYAELLERYHNNNLLRDKIFTGYMVDQKAVKSKSGKKAFAAGNDALAGIKKNKKIKVVVTGGFHSRGLENLFEEKQVSYIVIMPKITGNTSDAYNIHLDTIKGYGEIQQNTINIEPLSQEPLLISFPKVLASGIYALGTLPQLQQLSTAQKEDLLKEVIADILEKHSKGYIYVDSWEVTKYDKNKISEVSVKYKDLTRPEYEKTTDYQLDGTKLQDKRAIAADKEKAVHKKDEPGNVLSTINGIFADTNSAFYKIYTVLIAPVWEEFVFKVLPFGAVVLLLGGNSVFIAPAIITSVFGLALFPLAHTFADKIINNTNNKIRTISDLFYPSAVLTTVFLAVSGIGMFFAPWYIAVSAGYIASVAVHAVNNILVLKNKIKGIILSIIRRDIDSNLYEIIDRLEEIATKYYGLMYSDTWKLEGDGKTEMLSIIDELKKADNAALSEKYEIMSAQFSRLYDLIASDNAKYHLEVFRGYGQERKKNNYYFSFFSDLRKTVADFIEGFEYYDTGIPLTDMYNNVLFDLNIDRILQHLETRHISNDSHDRIRKEAINKLTLLDEDTPAEEKNRVISEQISALFKLISKHNDVLLPLIAPFASEYKDLKTGRPLFLKIIDIFYEEHLNIKTYSEVSDAKDQTLLDKNISLKSAVSSVFNSLYPLNPEPALEMIKFLRQYGYISGKDLIGDKRDVINTYKDYKKYFLAINGKSQDAELDAAFKDFSSRLKALTLPDTYLNHKKNEIAAEFENLIGIIDASNSQIAEFQVREAFPIISQLTDNGKLEEADEIMSCIVPLMKALIARSGTIAENTSEKLRDFAEESDYKSFVHNGAVEILAYAIKHSDEKYTREDSSKNLYNAAKSIYKGLNTLEKDSDAYREREEAAFKTLQVLINTNPESRDVDVNLFTDFGLSEKTLSMLLEAFKKNNSKDIRLNVHSESKINYSEKIPAMLIDAGDNINLERSIERFLKKGGAAEKIAFEVIDIMFEMAENRSNNKDMREKIALSIARLAAVSYEYITDNNIIDIARLNLILKDIGMNAELGNLKAYIKSFKNLPETGAADDTFDKYDEVAGFYREYNYTEHILNLPESVLPQNRVIVKSPVYFEIIGNTDKNDFVIKNMLKEFNNLQELLKFNAAVLEMSSKINISSSQKDMINVLKSIFEMTSLLMEIDYDYGLMAEYALSNIYDSIPEEMTKEFINLQKDLKQWEVRAEDVESGINPNMIELFGKEKALEDAMKKEQLERLGNIKGINTLVNAIHQLSIREFKQKIHKLKDLNQESIRTIRASQNDTDIKAYDLSYSSMLNKDIKEFLIKLAEQRPSIDDFIVKDDLVVWTTRLFAHSVDIFFNFGKNDRGITIYYREANRELGKAERVRYFSEALRRLGFDVDSDTRSDTNLAGTVGLKAVINSNTGLNDETDLVELAVKSVMLYKHSTNLDFQLEKNVDKNSPAGYELYVFNALVEKFLAGDIWYGYAYTSNGIEAFPNDSIAKRSPNPGFNMTRKFLNNILSYLELPEIPDINTRSIDNNIIEQYFNKPIERAFADGKIILNDDGILMANQQYDMIGDFMKSINPDALQRMLSGTAYDKLEADAALDELHSKSRIVNLAGRDAFSYRTMAFAGKYMFVSGYVKVPQGYLSVRGFMHPSTGRMKYTQAYLVDKKERKVLTDKELDVLLSENGFYFYEAGISEAGKDAHERTGERERREIVKGLYDEVKNIDSREIVATGISEGKGTYVAGNINFDRKNIEAGDILVVSYTTPDDIDAITDASAVLTTGGGVLSHAAITTRERQKTAATIGGASIDMKKGLLDTYYYDHSGGIEEINGIKFKRVERKRMHLKKGARVLVNGETGSVLLFNDINKEMLDEVQKYIDGNDRVNVIKFLKKNKDSQEIRRLVEYVLFQVSGNADLKEILFALFEEELPKNIKEKITELNESYVRQKMAFVRDALETLKVNIETKPYMAYALAENLIKKLDNTAGHNGEMKKLKEDVLEMHEKIKDSLQINLSALAESGERIILDFDRLKNDSRLSSEKKQLSKKDLREIIRINKLSSVYNNFISEIETRDELVKLKERLENINSRFDEIITGYRNSVKKTLSEGVLGLDSIYEEDSYRFGSKTTELALIKKLIKRKNIENVLVPDGVGISSDVIEIYLNLMIEEYNKITEGTEAAKEDYLKVFREAIADQNFDAARRAAEQIRRIIDDISDKSEEVRLFEKELNGAIQSKLDPKKRVSIRSSGDKEDHSRKAYAGIGESQLDVGYHEIIENLKKTLRGFYSDRSISYVAESGEAVNPAVLIQEMISAEKSGVAFSRNKYGRMTVEASYGIGELIVSGIGTPDSMIIDAETGEVIEYSVADKKIKIVATGAGTQQEVVTSGSQERVFNNDETKFAAGVFLFLEQDVGYAVDVEFSTVGSGKNMVMYILQRRAVTTNASFQISGAAAENKDGAAEHGIAVLAGDISDFKDKKKEKIVDMPHPENGETVTFYRVKEKKEGNKTTTVLMIGGEYAELLNNRAFLYDLLARLNNDKVVRNRLSPSLFAAPQTIALVPVYYDADIDESVLNNKGSIIGISKLLAAA